MKPLKTRRLLIRHPGGDITLTGVEPKLTPEAVRFIRKAHKIAREGGRARGGVSAIRGVYHRLAEKFGVSPNTIKDVILKRNWKQVK